VSKPERLSVIILHVSDLAKSLHFYRDLLQVPLEPGSNAPVDDPWFGGQHAELSWREGAYLHFALFPVRPTHRVTSGVELAFPVDDAARMHERLTAAGATVLHAPRLEPWGWCARYLDPDGNVVGVTSRARAPG
jgi:lactoylglutathione lyase